MGPEQTATPPADLPTDTSATPDPLAPAVDVPLSDLPQSVQSRPIGSSRGVPILMYHYIRVNPVPTDRIGFGLSITPAAFPILNRYGFRATFYIITAFVGRPRYMTWDQVRELDFCYPAGRFNSGVEEMVARVGYKTATTELPGPARQGDDLLALPRVRVYGGVTLEEFAKLLQGTVPARPTRVPGRPIRVPVSPTRAPAF